LLARLDFDNTQARCAFAEALRELTVSSSSAHSSVKAHAVLLRDRINHELRAFGVEPSAANAAADRRHRENASHARPRGMSGLAQANWQVFCDALNKPEQSGGGTLSCVVM
jgi:hypothetical protein